ncbi:MAG TPA: pyruvate kinase [Vicinamibacterales bacterium]
MIPQLAASGATAFRVNASHLDLAGLSRALARIREACPDAPIVVDLQGAKMRVGLCEPRDVTREQILRFSTSADGDVQVPHAELFRQATVGDTVSVNDGRLRFEVVRRTTDHLEGRALNSGRLLPRTGVNVEQHPVRLQGLTARDAEMCHVATRHRASALAFSFMTDGDEAAWLRAASPGCRVIGKVERSEATTHLDQIAARVDGIWICRGDLGVQLGFRALARFVGALEPARYPVPVLMAGQVLEHITSHPDATRSEVCHLFDLVERGFAGIVLSDETAIGRDPVHAVSTAAGLLTSFRS